MSINTEQGAPLLTESGSALQAENETESGQGGGGGGGGQVISLTAKATLRLKASGTIQIEHQRLVFLHGKAALRLVASGRPIAAKLLKAKATLKLVARKAAATAPTASMRMEIVYDTLQPTLIREQYLLVWFNGNPNFTQVKIQIDDGPLLTPAYTWQNSGVMRPAILKIDSAEIAGDGRTHRISAMLQQQVGSQTSATKTTRIYATTPRLRPAAAPEWCGATLIRQGDTVMGDLSRVAWRHEGAVAIMARVPVLNSSKTAWTTRDIQIGVADYDEKTFLAENVGANIGVYATTARNVYFGVAAIDNGGFGPVRWSTTPVPLNNKVEIQVETNPDTGNILHYTESSFVFNPIKEVGLLFHPKPASLVEPIAQAAYDQMKRRIKIILSKGGRVTLDDFGTLEARWNADRTVRSVAFVPSAGLKEGVKQGQVMTDLEAKAA